VNHDQNFKNLILDYPHQALAFLAESEARRLAPEVRITPIRQEQLKERLGDRFRELDVPLLVEWPTGDRAALVFVIEEETDARRFSIVRLAHYCLDIAELAGTRRVVPVVVFLRGGPAERTLTLGSDTAIYLRFHFISVELAAIPYRRFRDSDNLVARLNLPNMKHASAERVDVYAAAVRGLVTLEPDPERQLKYLDFIDIYSALDENERQRYEVEYQQEAKAMGTFLDRLREESEQQGLVRGEAMVLQRLMRLKFGELPEEVYRRIETADADTLLIWSERILTAERVEDVLH
jgi:hypothetical protein